MALCSKPPHSQHLALVNNFTMTKKFLITKFDCANRDELLLDNFVDNFVPFPEVLHNPCYFRLHLTLKENLLQAPSHSLKGKNEKRAFDFFFVKPMQQ